MTRRSGATIAVLAFVFVAVSGVLLRPLMPVDETRYLAVAWEMWLSGDFLVPTKNFALYTHKPPLLFWLMNLVWAFTGVSEVAARLVAPCFSLLALLLTGHLARRLWPEDPDAGSRAIIVLAGSVVFVVLSGLTMFDGMLALSTVLGAHALLSAVDSGAKRWWLAFGAAIALGVLSKGPVILFHLGPMALLAPVWARGRRPIGWRDMAFGLGIALGFAIALVCLWLVPAIISGGHEYRDAVLWTQSAGRMAKSFAHARPWWFFLALLPLFLFPWVFIPTLWRAVRNVQWREPGLSLALIWAGGALVLFSLISGKQVHYLNPEMPAVALIVARLTRHEVFFRPTLPALPLLAAALAAIVVTAGNFDLGDVGRLLHPSPILLGWALVVIAVSWIALQSGGLKGGTILTLGAVLSINLLIGLTDTRQIYDTHRVASAIAPYRDQGIALYGQFYNAEFNFAGRLETAVATPASLGELERWVGRNPGGIVIARPGRVAPDWPLHQTIVFRNSAYGLWKASDAPQGKPVS
jgi:4-amino-4-deoxy-L-arabinose transferase-like glycosyltransferase